MFTLINLRKYLCIFFVEILYLFGQYFRFGEIFNTFCQVNAKWRLNRILFTLSINNKNKKKMQLHLWIHFWFIKKNVKFILLIQVVYNLSSLGIEGRRMVRNTHLRKVLLQPLIIFRSKRFLFQTLVKLNFNFKD